MIEKNDEIPEPMNGIIPKNVEEEEVNKEFIEQAIRQHKTKEIAAKAVIELGWEYYNSGDMVTAMRRFNQAWLLDSDNADSYWGFAMVLSNQNRLDESIEMYEKTIKMSQKNKFAYSNFGLLQIKKGDFEKAIKNISHAIALDDTFAQFYNDRGVAYFYAGMYEKSSQDVQKAIKLGYAIHPDFIFSLEDKLGRKISK